jgi:hypothetical protein
LYPQNVQEAAWILVTAASNGTPITNAAFSCPYYNHQDGWYGLVFPAITDVWVTASNYTKVYFTQPSMGPGLAPGSMVIALTPAPAASSTGSGW